MTMIATIITSTFNTDELSRKCLLSVKKEEAKQKHQETHRPKTASELSNAPPHLPQNNTSYAPNTA